MTRDEIRSRIVNHELYQRFSYLTKYDREIGYQILEATKDAPRYFNSKVPNFNKIFDIEEYFYFDAGDKVIGAIPELNLDESILKDEEDAHISVVIGYYDEPLQYILGSALAALSTVVYGGFNGWGDEPDFFGDMSNGYQVSLFALDYLLNEDTECFIYESLMQLLELDAEDDDLDEDQQEMFEELKDQARKLTIYLY